ncbi:MAG: hypothetical protein WC516_09880 [Patescibacteria group bacterium]|jgi:DNA replication protein DnaC
MKELGYCVECRKLSNDKVCPNCQNIIRNNWRECLPERYRLSDFSQFDNIPRKIIKWLSVYASNFVSGERYSKTGLIIYGDVGVGKTMLVSALCNCIIDRVACNYRSQYSPIIWKPDQQFVSECQWANSARGDKPLHELIEDLSNKTKNRLLVIDDVGKGTPRLDVALSSYNFLIDQIYNKLGWLVIVSNYSLSETKEYLGYYAVDRLIQLCGTNFMFEMKGDSLRE